MAALSSILDRFAEGKASVLEESASITDEEVVEGISCARDNIAQYRSCGWTEIAAYWDGALDGYWNLADQRGIAVPRRKTV